MSPRSITTPLVREPPRILTSDSVGTALRAMLEHEIPAVPVVRATGELVGVFGEREFLEALFPRYFSQLKSAGFVRRSLDEALEKRAGCTTEPVSDHLFTEHVEVRDDASDSQIAETFLHHSISMLPVIDDDRRVVGLITREGFFRSLAVRTLEHNP